MEYVNIFQGDFIMGVNALLNLATKFLGGAGASQQPIQKTEAEAEQKPATPLEQVNAAVRETNPQELNQLHAASEQVTTAPSTAAIMPEVLQNNKAEPLNVIKQQGEAAPAIKLEISQKAVETLKPILSAFKDLVKSLLPELNLKELAATAKPMLQALSQASSNPTNTASTAANPA